MKNLIDTKYWLFDLDNTLYSGQTKVFSEVDKKMSSFISKKFNVDLVKAREIQKEYFYEYGTTLSGLMNHDKIDPHEFLEFVHDIDISWLPKDELLREELIIIKEKKNMNSMDDKFEEARKERLIKQSFASSISSKLSSEIIIN